MRLGFVILAFLAVFIQTSLESQSRVRLLRPGTFLIEPPRILPTEQWFGLRRAGDKWDLISVAPKIVPAQAICGDRATHVSVDAASDLLILLTGVGNLSEGPVGAAIHRPRLLHPGEALDIGAGYSLEALGGAIREAGGIVYVNYTLWIRHGREAQQVASFARNGRTTRDRSFGPATSIGMPGQTCSLTSLWVTPVTITCCFCPPPAPATSS